MLIIFESADLCGKSTLIKAFKEKYHFLEFKYFKVRARYPETWMNYIDLVAEAEYNAIKQLAKSKWLILDRFHISSLIYNKLYKRNYDVSYINEAEISPFLVVYVSVTKEILMQRATRREECNLILDKLTELHKAYEDFFATYKGPFIKVGGNEDVNINAELIYDRLRQA